MALDLANYEKRTQEAIQAFWGNRDAARKKQIAAGKIDQGERSGVTGGKNMDGFVALVLDLVQANGLGKADIHRRRAVVTLPGFFRPTKLWDLVIVHKQELIAALEFKSQIGPSFGNNFNNRAEKAIGTGRDFWTAYRRGAFGQPRPFLGRLTLVEDSPKSRAPVKDSSPHFPVLKEFKGASYLTRYDLLCQRLVQEHLYTTAALITSPRTAVETGAYSCMSSMTDIRTFVASFAGHIAAESARLA